MFSALRVKLIITYALVIVLSLVLAGTAFAVVIQGYQTQRQLNELADNAVPLAFQVRALQRNGATAADLASFLRARAADLNVRIFLIGPDQRIHLDTEGSLVGVSLPVPLQDRRRLGMSIGRGDFVAPDGQRLTFVQVDSSALRLGRGVPAPLAAEDRLAVDNLVVAVPEERITQAWAQFAPSLAIAGVIALVISTGVALFLARSIARPILQVTRASEHMARGDFDQFIPVTSPDEVGQLARSFNTMAQEVGRMHRATRNLLADVSHELRTPLTSIEGFAQAMTDGTLTTSEELRDAALVIGEEAERMNRLVNDLLYLSKIESGQVSIEHVRFCLTDLLRSCVRQIQPQAERAGVAIEVEAEEITEVEADRLRLQQVIVNLLANAVRHTPPGGRVSLRAYAASGAGPGERGAEGLRWTAVDVHNAGSYIPPAHRERIFERFFQIDGSGAREGSGLGLAIVREIVQAHHGKIEVRSDPVDGTTFTVRLPAA